jgi:hypothetical protein
MRLSYLIEHAGSVYLLPLTQYQTELVWEWERANPGSQWHPDIFGWVFFPHMLERLG